MTSVEVGRSAWPSDRPFVALIPTVTLMTQAELKCGQNKNSVHMFKHGLFKLNLHEAELALILNGDKFFLYLQ